MKRQRNDEIINIMDDSRHDFFDLDISAWTLSHTHNKYRYKCMDMVSHTHQNYFEYPPQMMFGNAAQLQKV